MSQHTNAVNHVEARIEIFEGGVSIHEMYVARREVGQYLQRIEQEFRANAIVEALEVGIFCLERAKAHQDIEFVRRQIEAMLGRVESATQSIPKVVEDHLLSRLGTQDGQALAPIRIMTDELKKSVGEKLHDVRVMLSEDIDPSREGSKLGKAIRAIGDLLDPNRKTSVQSVISDAAGKISGKDGVLARTVKEVVQEAIEPLANEINRLAKENQASQAVREALEHTAAKGSTYEDEVVHFVEDWARRTGIEIRHVGADRQAGDVLLTSRRNSLAGLDLTIVIEVRDRSEPAGRRRITEDLARAMAQRSAKAAIYVTRTREGLANEVGDWAEGECEGGHYVATTHTHLITAVRYLLQRQRLTLERASLPAPDVDTIESQLQRVRLAMDRLAEINRNVTGGKAALDAIRNVGEAIRIDVRDALLRAEEAVRRAAAQKVPA